ncbi:MAG: hypothetical protein DI629_17590 [Mesorhizobium amorphae]|nr:MAG: hypothetical protein DI629_17590 [Mesorhizobium amorphae]
MSRTALDLAMDLARGPGSEVAIRARGRPSGRGMTAMVRSALAEALAEACGEGLESAWLSVTGSPRDASRRDLTFVEVEAILRMCGGDLVDLSRSLSHKIDLKMSALPEISEDLP